MKTKSYLITCLLTIVLTSANDRPVIPDVPSTLLKLRENSRLNFRINTLRFNDEFTKRVQAEFKNDKEFAFDAKVTSFVKDYVCLYKMVKSERLSFDPTNFEMPNYTMFQQRWNERVVQPSMQFDTQSLTVGADLLDSYLTLLAKFCGENPCPNTCCPDCSPKPCK